MNAVRWVWVFAVILLTACGFKLRGEQPLPAELSVLRVQVADTFSPLQHNLEQALARGGARAPAADEISAVLRIDGNQMTRWPLTVGSAGRVQEYSMRYELSLQLISATGEVVMPKQSLQLERSYQFATVRAQGTPGEEDVVREELERDMVQAILRRLQVTLARR